MGGRHLDFDLYIVKGLQYTHTLYLDLESAKKIHVLQVLIWGFGGCWRFLTGVRHLDLGLDIVSGL